jgi:2-dehydropantoate 2-reductase
MQWANHRIYIIGAGAIGKSLAVFLKLSGRQVTIIRGSVNDGSTSTERIRIEMADGTRHQADLDITTLENCSEIGGLVVLANKSFGNARLAAALKSKTGRSPIVLLQNGLGIEQPFITQQYPEIYRCVLFVTSQAVAPNTVRFKSVAVCPVGIEFGSPERLDGIVRQLTTPEFAFRSEPDIQQIIWKKVIVNCVFNTVCPLLEVDNGIFYKETAAHEIARRIISECVAVARAKGIALRTEEVEQSLIQISRLSDGQEISTLQDIRNNRRTEIETLNPEIVKIAQSLNMVNLVRETRLLGELTRLKAYMNMQGSKQKPI